MAEQQREIHQSENLQVSPTAEPPVPGAATLVAELDRWGVSYLSQHVDGPESLRDPSLPPQVLISALIQQPNARLRSALIALFLARPGLWHDVDAVRTAMPRSAQLRLMLFYSASVLLQEIHRVKIQERQGSLWQPLPDLYAEALGLGQQGSPSERLKVLALTHGDATGQQLNWHGTYCQAAAHLLHQWELSRRWNR